MKRAFESIWREPAAPDRPPVGPCDRLLGLAIAVIVVIEAFVRSDLAWPVAAAAFGLVLAAATIVRRPHSLVCVVTGFVGFAVLDAAALFNDSDPIVLYAGMVVFLFTYALFRWAPGSDVIIGFGAIAVSTTVIIAADFSSNGFSLDDAIGGPVVLLLGAALGLAVRFRSAARIELIGRAKLQEREQLARELHDTVAHHVSAITIQAQAGLVMARSSSLAGATEALETIESEAARTLDEMRMMVGALRDRDGLPDVSPMCGLDDIERLASRSTGSTTVGVQLSGDLAGLPPAVEAALYRVAQESVTNALRHADGPTHVGVTLTGTTNDVTMTIVDDGAPSVTKTHPSGFGLLGMTERVAVFDGTLTAGPSPDRGWRVQAVLPRAVSPV